MARAAERMLRTHKDLLMVDPRSDTPVAEPYREVSPACEAELRSIASSARIQQPGYPVDYFLLSSGQPDPSSKATVNAQTGGGGLLGIVAYLLSEVIPYWHGFQDATRPIRHQVGIRKNSAA